MALGQDDSAAPASTFTWGAGGARLTPEEIAARRKVADALMAQGTDASPLPAGTRGAGMWTQGLARVAKGVSAGLDYREADQAAKANADDNKAMIATLLAGGGAPAASPTAAAASDAPAVATAPTAAPSPASAAGLDPETTGYIKSAADRYGVDPAYLTRTAMLESGGNPNATNTKSGAAGLFQFMPKTAKEYELDNPLDPEDSAMAAAELAKDNRETLASALGRAPTNAELYLAHQQGAGGASKLLTNPNARAVDVLGQDAVLSNGGTPDMTAGQFASKWISKYGPDAAPPAAVAPVQVASNGPVIVPSTPIAAPTDIAPAGGVAKVAAAMPADPAALPSAAMPTQGFAVPGQPAAAAPAAPGVAKVAGALGGVNPAVLQAVTSPYADDATKKIAGLILQQQLSKPQVGAPYNDPNLGMVQRGADGTVHVLRPPQAGEAYKDADGNLLQKGPDGSLHSVIKADSDPTSVKEYQFYQKNLPPGQTPMDYGTWATAKARAAATSINQPINVDMNSGQTYDKQLAEGLGKSHAALANGVEDAQSRARDIAAMQGAVDAIQKNGGTTGGLAPAQRLELQKSINAGAAALGIDKPFDEADLSDKEFLTKFNRSMAGAQAKNAVGSRVTNFEMSNFLKANPGLDMTITGNQRLLGIQGQIEQRNIAVGNAIREATAQAISQGKKIDPVTVQKIITDYDAAHHVQDPTTGQDLTQSYALPEFQQANQGTNAGLATQHSQNMGPTQKIIGGKTYVKQPNGQWHEAE